MNAVSVFLCSYADSLWQSTQHLEEQPEFVRWVDSNLILFGYQAGKFFETHYDDPETFKADKNRLSGLLERVSTPPKPSGRQSLRVENWRLQTRFNARQATLTPINRPTSMSVGKCTPRKMRDKPTEKDHR